MPAIPPSELNTKVPSCQIYSDEIVVKRVILLNGSPYATLKFKASDAYSVNKVDKIIKKMGMEDENNWPK